MLVVSEEMCIKKAAVTNAVMCKGVDYELLAWVVRCVGHDIMLVCWILMDTSKDTTLVDTTRSSCIFIRVIGTNCVLLMPLHSSVTRMYVNA